FIAALLARTRTIVSPFYLSKSPARRRRPGCGPEWPRNLSKHHNLAGSHFQRWSATCWQSTRYLPPDGPINFLQSLWWRWLGCIAARPAQPRTVQRTKGKRIQTPLIDLLQTWQPDQEVRAGNDDDPLGQTVSQASYAAPRGRCNVG